MTRFINSVLISLIAFFAFLAIFGYFGAERPNAEPSELTVEGATARWGTSDESGTGLVVGFTVRNNGHLPGLVDRLEYKVARDGVILGEDSQEPRLNVPAESAVPVQLAIRLPPEFAADWWTAYTTSKEATSLRVTGSLVMRGAADRPIPFEWSSSWQGNLSDLLEAPAHNCDGATQAVCLREATTSWTPGGLSVSMLLRNADGDPVIVRNGTVRLLFAGAPVADGSSTRAVEIAPNDEGRMPVVADFSQSAILSWWRTHVGRCEATQATLAVDLTVLVERAGGAGNEVQGIHWTFPAGAFRTEFVCGVTP